MAWTRLFDQHGRATTDGDTHARAPRLPPDGPAVSEADWVQAGKVKALQSEGQFVLVVDGLTSQAKYYKP